MKRRQRRELVARIVAELSLAPHATYQDTARRLCEVMHDRVGRPIEVRFTTFSDVNLTGVSALLDDGTFLVICADSPRWYHRLQILLHEFAHILLGHEPVTLTSAEGLRRFAPHMLPKMAQ